MPPPSLALPLIPVLSITQHTPILQCLPLPSPCLLDLIYTAIHGGGTHGSNPHTALLCFLLTHYYLDNTHHCGHQPQLPITCGCSIFKQTQRWTLPTATFRVVVLVGAIGWSLRHPHLFTRQPHTPFWDLRALRIVATLLRRSALDRFYNTMPVNSGTTYSVNSGLYTACLYLYRTLSTQHYWYRALALPRFDYGLPSRGYKAWFLVRILPRARFCLAGTYQAPAAVAHLVALLVGRF